MSSPEAAPTPEATVRALRMATSAPGERGPTALQQAAGVQVLEAVGPGRFLFEQQVPIWLREPGGAPSLGALAILADGAIGWSLMSSFPAGRGMVTAQLHLDIARPLRADDDAVSADAEARSVGGDVAFGSATVLDRAGSVIGWATLRAALVDLPAAEEVPGGPMSAEPVFADPPGVEAQQPASIAGALGVHDVSSSEDEIAMTMRNAPHLANIRGAVHGGVIALMGEHAVAAAMTAAQRDGMRPLELDVVYLRRLAADGSILRARAGVVQATRRFVVASAELVDAQGRTAALVRQAFGPT